MEEDNNNTNNSSSIITSNNTSNSTTNNDSISDDDTVMGMESTGTTEVDSYTVDSDDYSDDSYTRYIFGLMIEDANRLANGESTQHFGPDNSSFSTIQEIAEMILTGEMPTPDGLIDFYNEQDGIDNTSNNIGDESQNDSLVDDYADPNLEQPSHMDSDD
jgi:hypothetical protein